MAQALARDLLDDGFHHVEGASRNQTVLPNLLLSTLIFKCHVALDIGRLKLSLIKNPGLA